MINIILKSSIKEVSVFLIAILVGLAVISFSGLYWQGVGVDKQQADSELSSIKRKFNDALSRKRVLEIYETKYAALNSDGFVGEEDRAEWLDALDRVIKDKNIPLVKYELSKQYAYPGSVFKAAFPGINIFVSTMTLQMELLHEGDLIVLFNDLDKKAKGVFDITECNIQRSDSSKGAILDNHSNRNIKADCKIDWITVKATTGQADE